MKYWIMMLTLTALYGCATRESRCGGRLSPINHPVLHQPNVPEARQ